MNSTRRRASLISAIFLFGLLIYFSWNSVREDGILADSSREVKFPVSEAINGDGALLKKPVTDAELGDSKARFSDLTPKQMADGRALIKEAKDHIFKQWQLIERGNFEEIGKRNTEAAARVTFRLNPASPEQLGKLSDFAGKELHRFRDKGVPLNLLRETIGRYVKELTAFQKRNTFIVIINPTDQSLAAKFWEISTDLDALPSDKDGNLTFPSGTILKEDADVGSEKSWASKRYGHLIEGIAAQK